MLKRISKIFLFLFLLFDIIYATELDLFSDKYILYNLNENEILMEKDSNVKANIASLTKMMTILVSIENIENFEEKITITKQMLSGIDYDVSVAGFKVGEKLTYNDLLYGAMLPSGADACQSLAIAIAGSQSEFVKMMNDKAKELKLENTMFANTVGLYDKDNYSTAYDMAQLLMHALKNEKFKEVFQTKNTTLTNGKKLKSTLQYYSNQDTSLITGSKTGYLKEAGRCLASTSTVDDVNYLLVTLNAYSKDKSVHVQDHMKIYNHYKDNYKYHTYISNDDILVTLSTEYAKEKEVKIPANVNKKIFHDNSFDKSKVKYEYNGIEEVTYFTEKGTKLGNVTIKYEDEIIDTIELTYDQELTFSLMDAMYNHIVEIILGLCIIIAIFRK
jgi:D-alanyl-D-alanine carboxypeptidase (penicillin-binding protein 5/6)